MSFEDVEAVLRKGCFGEFIGMSEDQSFECKPLDHLLKLSDDYYKFVLSKEVTAFANTSRGIVVYGLKTKRSSTTKQDIVRRVTELTQNEIDLGKILNVIEDWIYPRIEGLSLEWLPSSSGKSSGLVAIKIPNQNNIGPYLVKKTFDDQGSQQGSMVAYFRRVYDRAVPANVYEVQSIMRDGQLFRRGLRISIWTKLLRRFKKR